MLDGYVLLISLVNLGFAIHQWRRIRIREKEQAGLGELMTRLRPRLEESLRDPEPSSMPPAHVYALEEAGGKALTGGGLPLCDACHKEILSPEGLATGYGAGKLVKFHATEACAPFLDLKPRTPN